MIKAYEYLIKRKVILVFSLILLLLFIYLGLINNLSFKVNGDFYAILSTVQACKNYISGNFNKSIFPDALIFSPHTNVISWFAALVSIVLKIKPFDIFYFFGALGIPLLIFSYDYFLSSLAISTNRRALIIIASILLVPTIANFNYIGDGILSLSDLLLTSLGWRIFGFSLFFISLGLAVKIENQISLKKIILLTVASFFLANIHLLDFVIFFSLILAYFVFKSLLEKKFSKEYFTIVIFCAVGGLFNSIIWPFYNLFYLLSKSYTDFQSSPIIQDPQSYLVNNPLYYIIIFSISLLGYIYLLRENNKFLKFSIVLSTLIILLSLLTPLPKIPFFWRYAIVLKLFLLVVIFKNIPLYIKSYSTALAISLLIGLYTLYAGESINLISKRKDNARDLYNQLEDLNLLEGYILTDERTGNITQAIDNYKIFVIPSGHIASRTVSAMNLSRIENLQEILQSYDYLKINKYLIENDISYLVINNDASFVNTYKLINSNDFKIYPKILENSDLTVIRIIPL